MIATLLLGSNLGDSLLFLASSIQLIEVEVGGIVKKTSVLQNKAWGYESAHDYFNQIIQVETKLQPLQLLDCIEAIERKLGRQKLPCNWKSDREYQDRIIDIDILLYGDLQFENERLKVPHPRMNEREFVQALLKEL